MTRDAKHVGHQISMRLRDGGEAFCDVSWEIGDVRHKCATPAVDSI